jgi:hypothetical protein
MTLDALIMFAGAFVAVLPFLGFPNSWDTVLFFLAGVFVISLGIVVRRRRGTNRFGNRGNSAEETRTQDGTDTGNNPRSGN